MLFYKKNIKHLLIYLLLIINILIMIASCKKKDSSEFYKINLNRQDNDILVPPLLWEKIEEHYLSLEGIQIEDFNPIKISKDFFSINLKIKELNSKIFKKSNYKIIFPSGGGKLDLAQIFKESNPNIESNNKQFKLSFHLNLEKEKIENLKVFFINNNKQANLDNNNVIANKECNKFYDITSFFKKNLLDKDHTFTLKNLQYLKLLNGFFIFTSRYQKKILISQINITDSRYKNLTCLNL